MSWKEVDKVEQRARFVLRYLNGERMTDLCKEYDISRKTGYKFYDRYQRYGFEGLADRSSRPGRIARKTNEFMEEYVLAIKNKYPTWGPKKIKAKLEQTYAGVLIPAASTIGCILDKHGLVLKRSRRMKRAYYHSDTLSNSENPNDIWCIDFKGQFRTTDNKYCYPLTISDHYSRYLIACEALESTGQEDSYQVFRQAFQEYGLPKMIRSDNGTPFASANALYGLTKLSAWFLSLGIKLERIEKGHPEQNGRHERMHRTLKQDCLRPAANNILKQQEVFDRYMDIYNQERPHEALGQKVPAALYRKSAITLCENKELLYAMHDHVRYVSATGAIKLSDHKIQISSALAGRAVGLRELDSSWLVSYADYDLGFISKDLYKFGSLEYIEV